MKKKINLTILFLFFTFLIYGYPFFGGFYLTDNNWTREKFSTLNILSFYIENKFNEHLLLYGRITAGFRYDAFFPKIVGDQTIYYPNNSITNFSVIPNIDLLYLEFRTGKSTVSPLIKETEGEFNSDIFGFRIGRIYVNFMRGFLFTMRGDGIESVSSYKNFRMRFFAVSNSLDYLPLFDFADGSCNPVFTRWDTKRMPKLSNLLMEGYEQGFMSDYTKDEYNFYFNVDETTDYSAKDKEKLNNLRKFSVIAGRVFSGLSFEFLQVGYQNISFGLLANIDLIPEEFVLTFPSKLNNIANTFGGRYTSFYADFNINGKIYKNLYYNFDIAYETGFNATYYDDGSTAFIKYEAIHSFGFLFNISYYFSHITKPIISFDVMYGHGDSDVEFKNGTIVNKEGFDFSFKSPNSTKIGYAADADLSNLLVFSISNSIKPLSAIKNEIFSRFFLKSVLYLLLRPNIEGATFISEKSEYVKGGIKEKSPEKFYLGTEIDIELAWAIFSDLNISLKGGIFIPNYAIYDKNDILWKVGLSMNISF